MVPSPMSTPIDAKMTRMAKSKPLVGSLAWVLSSIVKHLLSIVPNKGANELLYSFIMTP